ncbi:SAM-dependent methyltransferase [Saccharopolyspora lacisalsi]|uniref:SAM-dependent methyltransferase n=1 Tax=Halosaccharopolyspora lacisalsi TaxID=1000566 RepID=A0A839DYE4_9PSEU|nr:methyltransferase domain-containing protein [Halosaccharopolyspora lacisalsi]MBA8824375.1 SAM-dependent methyltransferase [Halosaccharopolyspora lacisalsi]
MTESVTADLHAGFRRPERGDADTLGGFLHAVDQLPGIRRIHEAMRSAMAPRAGERLVDAGCGLGIETRRLAEQHPGIDVVGLDRNDALVRQAGQQRPDSEVSNLSWHTGDLLAPELDAGSVDVVRTERVLIYQHDLGEAADSLLSLLRPGGRLVSFELDYGATLLAPGEGSPETVRSISAAMESSLPQPWAGRRLPALLAERGVSVRAEPHAFAVNHEVWDRIVGETVRQALREGKLDSTGVEEWLAQQVTANRQAEMTAFTGVLTTAVV